MVVDLQVEELITNKYLYIERLMKVVDKNRNKVPFRFNPAQKKMWPYIGPGKRLLVLKARQLGCTTLYIAKFLADCLTIPGTVSVIASENEHATQRALAKAESLLTSIPPEWKPVVDHHSSYEFTWPELGSTMYIATARQNLLVRGDTVHNFLATEITRWPDPDGPLAAAEEAVPLDGGFIVIESTPFAEGDKFHTMVQASRRNQSAYKLVFLPWWIDPEYRIPMGSDLALDSDKGHLDYTPEELELIEKHNLDEEQMRWRRRKRSDRGLSFYQEYVEDIDGCFLTSGEMVLDGERLGEMAKHCYPAQGSFENTNVWFPPIEGSIYLIAADPTVGIHDKAAATVWLIGGEEGLQHCATLWGLYEPTIFAKKLMALGYHYNDAEIMVEFNGPGQAVLAEMKEYPNLGRQPDLLKGGSKIRLGWYTTKTSKPYMIAQTSQAIYTMEVHDIDIIRQLRGLRWYGQDVITVDEDDLAMSTMIAVAVYKEVVTIKRGLIGNYGWQPKGGWR